MKATKSRIVEENRCVFQNHRGQRCRAPRSSDRADYCYRHLIQVQRDANVDRIAKDLATYSGTFRTATDVNQALGELFKLIARNQIDRRTGHTLAYIGHLLVLTLKSVRTEIETYGHVDEWEEAVLRAFPPLPATPAPKPPPLAAYQSPTSAQAPPQDTNVQPA